jgi:glycosyltransferase involved in cell wall biosynthesis
MEGMPTVLAEAAASGLPLIGSRIAGIPLIIEHERTGLLVPSGDVVALAAAMQRLVNDAELRYRLGALAFTKAQDFAWPRIAEDFAEVYAEAYFSHKQKLTA